MKLFYNVVANKYSVSNYRRSVIQRMAYDGVGVSSVISPYSDSAIGKDIGLWGFKDGDNNIREYHKIELKDVLFFRTKNKEGCSSFDGFGYISGKLVSDELSQKVWNDSAYKNIIVIDRYIQFAEPFKLLEKGKKNEYGKTKWKRAAALDGVHPDVWYDGYNMFRQWDVSAMGIENGEELLIEKFLSQLQHAEVYSTNPQSAAISFKYDDQAAEGSEEHDRQPESPQFSNNNIYSGVLQETEKEALIKLRVGQGIFKRKLLNYSQCCKLCGLPYEKLLIGSHIKPWKDCDSSERLDENNGFLLCPQHDALFDKGWISFDKKGTILISGSLAEEDFDALNIHRDLNIETNQQQQKYLEWHRKKIFKLGES